MNPDFELILEDCLARLRSGSTLEDCLSFYPDQAEGLRPLLSTAAYVRSIPVPEARIAAIETGRQRMFAAFEQQNQAGDLTEAPISKNRFTRYTERTLKFLRFSLIGKENLNGRNWQEKLDEAKRIVHHGCHRPERRRAAPLGPDAAYGDGLRPSRWPNFT